MTAPIAVRYRVAASPRQPLFAVGAVLITRAPPGPFTPAPFGLAKGLLRKCGVSVT